MAKKAQTVQPDDQLIDVVVTEETLQMNPDLVIEGVEIGEVIQVEASGLSDEHYDFLKEMIWIERKNPTDALAIFKLRYPDSDVTLDLVNEYFL
jgi:hypothetical protein